MVDEGGVVGARAEREQVTVVPLRREGAARVRRVPDSAERPGEYAAERGRAGGHKLGAGDAGVDLP